MKTIKTLYPNGKIKAVTFSYDDGVCFDKKLIEMLNSYGLKGTFNISSGFMNSGKTWLTKQNDVISYITKEEAASVYKDHELAVHGHTHEFWTNMPNEQALYQLQENKRVLEEITNTPVRGLAYPFYSQNEDIIKMAEILGFRYARNALRENFFQIPKDNMQFAATAHHNDADLMEKANKFLNQTFNTLALFCVYGHTFEFENDNNWDVIENFCKLVANKDEIWYATCIDIFDYLHSAKQLRYTVDCSVVTNPTATDITIKVDNEVVIVKSGETLRL